MKLVRKIAPLAVVCALVGAMLYAWFSLGVRTYRIDSGSMHPTLPVGSFIITYESTSLDKRDIIVFDDGGELTAHTFIGYAKDGSVMTRGDANPTADVHRPPLQKSEVVGKVWRGVVPVAQYVVLVCGILIAVIWLIPTRQESSASSDKSSEPTPV